MRHPKRQTIPDGYPVYGSAVMPNFQIETYRNLEVLKHEGKKKTIIHATNHPAIELDLDWLPAAAESYHISPNPEDYILVSLPIVTANIPNRNLQGFQLEEISYFCPIYGCMIYQTFNKKCCHIDHQNNDPTKAKGVIADSNVQYVPRYDIWKINAVTLWDRSKDANLVKSILEKKRTGYSMGATVAAFLCSICGKVDNLDDHSCEHMKNKGKLYPVRGSDYARLAYQICSGTVYFEISSVSEPADPSAVSLDVYI